MNKLLALVALALLSQPALAQDAPKWSIAIHGGAGTLDPKAMTPEKRAEYEAALQLALDAGATRLLARVTQRSAQALALADAVHPDCGVCLDAYHLNMEESNIYDAIRLAGKRLFDFHVADNNRFAAGLGHLDWARIIGTLREIGYDGALTNEFVAPVDRTPAAPYPYPVRIQHLQQQ